MRRHFFAGLTVHVTEYHGVYDALFGTSSLALLETAKTHLPNLATTSYSFDVRPALLFTLRALSTMCGVPILVFRHHNVYVMDLIVPYFLLDNLPKYASVMVLACNGVANLVPCLLRKPMEIKPATHMDVVEDMVDIKPQSLPTNAIDITSAVGKRTPDLMVGGGMGAHAIQTNTGTAQFNAARTPPKDTWSPFETIMFLSYVHKCLKNRGNKKELDAPKMLLFGPAWWLANLNLLPQTKNSMRGQPKISKTNGRLARSQLSFKKSCFGKRPSSRCEFGGNASCFQTGSRWRNPSHGRNAKSCTCHAESRHPGA